MGRQSAVRGTRMDEKQFSEFVQQAKHPGQPRLFSVRSEVASIDRCDVLATAAPVRFRTSVRLTHSCA